LAARVQPRPAGAVAEEAAELRLEVEQHETDAQRRRWLTAQLDGVEAACRFLAAEAISYRELVQRCYGIEAELVPETVFADAHARLDDALPGNGSLRERFEAWASTQYVAPELLEPGFRALLDELRERTNALFGPLGDDRVEVAVVEGQPWLGLCDYVGGLVSRISLNADLPIASYRLLELATHEVYPGHHTEHVLKEPLLCAGRQELAVFLYTAPQALVAEGIAELAQEILLGDDADRIGAELLEPLGIAYDAETAAVARAVKGDLRSVRPNIALLLDDGVLDESDAYAYARRWMIDPDATVDRSIRVLLEATWRPYGHCYPLGETACGDFVAGDPTRFRRLLAEQLTTADLAT
jgi:hypothetical protein